MELDYHPYGNDGWTTPTLSAVSAQCFLRGAAQILPASARSVCATLASKPTAERAKLTTSPKNDNSKLIMTTKETFW